LTKKGEVKVADFGLSRMLLANSDAKHLTQTGITMGTPLYMAPEQVEGKPTDHRTDIYSLGVTCYHLLAGQPPFEGENAFAVALQHVQREPVPLEAMRPDLPPSLCALVHKMLAKKPEDRPQSAGEILRQLKLLTENTPGTRGDVALSALNLPTLPAPLDLEAAYAKTQVGTPPKPGRRRAWLLWPALVVGSLAVALGGGALTAMALRPPPEEPLADRPEAPNSTTLETLLGSYNRKERGYRDLIEETESPGRERENLRRGIQHRIDLGLLYLDQVPRDLDRAEELFAAQQKSKVREYEQIGRLGMAMVHAFRDEPEKSNQLLMESLAQSRETGPLALGPNLRWLRMLLAAMDYNKRNCQAQKLRYPPELLAYEAGLRRVPGVPPVPPPAVPSVPERPRQP
jgi:serine/threonine-protein kinase